MQFRDCGTESRKNRAALIGRQAFMKNLPGVLMIFRSGALRPEKQQEKNKFAVDLD